VATKACTDENYQVGNGVTAGNAKVACYFIYSKFKVAIAFWRSGVLAFWRQI